MCYFYERFAPISNIIDSLKLLNYNSLNVHNFHYLLMILNVKIKSVITKS